MYVLPYILSCNGIKDLLALRRYSIGSLFFNATTPVICTAVQSSHYLLIFINGLTVIVTKYLIVASLNTRQLPVLLAAVYGGDD